jgi:hypothetical protein
MLLVTPLSLASVGDSPPLVARGLWPIGMKRNRARQTRSARTGPTGAGGAEQTQFGEVKCAKQSQEAVGGSQ